MFKTNFMIYFLLSTVPLRLPYHSQWYHSSQSISESFLTSPSSPSTNSAGASLKIYLESTFYHLHFSKPPPSLTWIATVVSCSPLIVPRVLFQTSVFL